MISPSRCARSATMAVVPAPPNGSSTTAREVFRPRSASHIALRSASTARHCDRQTDKDFLCSSSLASPWRGRLGYGGSSPTSHPQVGHHPSVTVSFVVIPPSSRIAFCRFSPRLCIMPRSSSLS